MIALIINLNTSQQRITSVVDSCGHESIPMTREANSCAHVACSKKERKIFKVAEEPEW